MPLKARACPECGSDEETGWSEAASYSHLLPYTGDSETNASASKTWQKYSIAAIAIFVITVFLASQGFSWSFYVIPLIALAGSIAYYASRRYKSSRWGMEKQLYQQLLKRTRSEKKLAQKLIEYERQLSPGSNQLQLLQNAIYRWDRDRR